MTNFSIKTRTLFPSLFKKKFMKKTTTLLLVFLFFASTICFAQNINGTLQHDGETRTYITHLPPGFNANESVPLVIALHGLGDSPSNFMGIGLNTAADTANFIAVYPATIDFLLGGTAWNNGANPFGMADDVGFIAALIDQLHADYNIDLSRVYATGFSMGGMMSHRLACDLSDRIAAIAAGSGTMPNSILPNCNPERPVPVMHVHGTDDGTVPYAGSPLLGLGSVEATIDKWVDLNSCAATPTIESVPDAASDGLTIEKAYYNQCEASSEVVLYTVTGMGHSWLGSANDIHETAEIWRFFSQHVLEDVSVGMETEEAIRTIKAYPNPVTDQLYINLGTAQVEHIAMYNLIGEMVYEQAIESGRAVIEVPFSHLPKGAYVVRVMTAQGAQTLNVVK